MKDAKKRLKASELLSQAGPGGLGFRVPGGGGGGNRQGTKGSARATRMEVLCLL